MAESKGLLEWRKKQPRGAIMQPETFAKIRRQALAKGLGEARAEKVAGKAYWTTAESKYKKRKT